MHFGAGRLLCVALSRCEKGPERQLHQLGDYVDVSGEGPHRERLQWAPIEKVERCAASGEDLASLLARVKK